MARGRLVRSRLRLPYIRILDSWLTKMTIGLTTYRRIIKSLKTFMLQDDAKNYREELARLKLTGPDPKAKKNHQLRRSPLPKSTAKMNARIPNTIPKLLEKAQRAFNTWIRHRDQNRPCISCGSWNTSDAGHYYAAGLYTALRFNETNVNIQCKKCNRFQGGNQINYRKGLVALYGESIVLMLENSADLRRHKKWSRFELEAIIYNYKIIGNEEK